MLEHNTNLFTVQETGFHLGHLLTIGNSKDVRPQATVESIKKGIIIY